ncbi:MFS transporter, DHA2 family, multidrug resistance protein [Hydrocarboniphaga daqingensis]|uniref:MFS transporter, DHA2 family, multidrug resistance protein n=1 Tax=Hydrocarboniphaga daqingensis TaxID=490188 RepID=A0A1M5LUC3_9GAMM|nr:DHA2 family efflux MFS transporter permease subunit [Hydrocarboniphaga daqingensis]SHG68657.1 MFS transporter, DHA2 family, multidrug resistance protein [Hydrocarboniphaga daqingensis]
MSAAAASAAPAMPPVKGSHALVATALAVGTFMQVLDTTIANVSIPTISGNLGVANDQGTWVITSFAVANGISVPLTGWLMQRFGVVRVFVLSVLAFTIASFLCGIAWSLPSLILFRVLQGAVSGPMIPGSQALLISIFPPHKKGMALAIWSMTTLVAPICGPLLGGHISDNYSWPWIFLINVPVGLFCAAICWSGLKGRETPTRKIPIDGIGLSLLVVWVGALQIMLDTGKDADWFSSPAIVVEAIVAGVGFIAFMIWELGEKNPIIDLSLFRNRNFSFGVLAFCIGYALFFGSVVLQPLWMQTWLGYTATWAGLVAAPSGMVAVLLSPLVGKNIGRFDPRWFATASFIVFGISYFMRSNYTADASYVTYMLPLLVQGIGMSMFFVAMLTILLDGVPDARVPAASGLSNFLRITAGSFSTSITTTFWDRHAALHQSRLAEATSVYDPRLQQSLGGLRDLGLNPTQALGAITRTMSSQAYLMSALDFFWICGWISFSVAGIVWLTRRPRGAAHAVAAD